MAKPNTFDNVYNNIKYNVDDYFSVLIKEVNDSLLKLLKTTVWVAESIDLSIQKNFEALPQNEFTDPSENLIPLKLEQQGTPKKITQQRIISHRSKLAYKPSISRGILQDEKFEPTDATSLDEDSFDATSLCSVSEKQQKNVHKTNDKKLQESRNILSSYDLQNTAAYNCEECEYDTTNKTWLKQHIKAVHMRIKDFICSHCSYASSWKKHLTRHMKSKHGVS